MQTNFTAVAQPISQPAVAPPNNGGAAGASLPPDSLIGRPAPYPWQTNGTFTDVSFRPGWWGPGPKGYGLDLNGDGKYNPRQDGMLSFDFNGDGHHSDQEIHHSNTLLKAFSGNFDQNGDGFTDWNEQMQGFNNFFQARSMDLDRDGVLSNWELQRAGGAVVRPGEQGGYGRRGTKQQVFDLNFLPNGQRLNYLDPWRGRFSTTPNYILFSRPQPEPFPLARPAVQPDPRLA